MTLTDRIASAKKALIGAASIVSALLALGLIPTPYDKYAAAALGILGSYGIYAVKNKPTPAQLLAQPNYVPSVAHIPMPVPAETSYDPGPNQSYLAPSYIAELEARAKPKHDPKTRTVHPMTKMLGRRPPKNAPALKFADHLVSVPEHPIADLAPDLSWPMDHNDTVGCCVVAGADHALQAISSQLGVARQNWGDSTLLALYQTQNPHFTSWDQGGTSVDQGMDVQTFLEYLVKHKLILGFAKVDHGNVEEMKAAVYLGLAIVTGETLTQRNMTEQTWDYYAKDQVAGGHCTTSVGYKPTENQVSWGALYSMTDRFLAKNVEEAWFIVTQAHVDHPAFRAGFNLDSFAAAYTEITGGATFPVPITPDPVPVPPTPTPTPSPATDDVLSLLDSATLATVTSRAAKKQESVQQYAAHAITAYVR